MTFLFLAFWFFAGLVLVWFSISGHASAQTARMDAVGAPAKRPGPKRATPLGLFMFGLSWVLGSLSITGLIYFDPNELHLRWDLLVILSGFFGPLLLWGLADCIRPTQAERVSRRFQETAPTWNRETSLKGTL